MVKTIPTKRGTGISIYGLAHDLKYVYDVVHYIATTLDQGNKGVWWMPWYREAMKGVANCDKPRGAVSRL